MIKKFKNSIGSFIIAIFAALLITGCASKPPLPSNITFIAPSPDLLPELSAFYGTWKGRLDDRYFIVASKEKDRM